MIKKLFITLATFCLIVSCQFTYDEGIAKNLAGFAIMAYCTNPNIPKNNCGAPCQQNPQGLQNFVEVFNASYNARAILGYSPDNNAIIISFRGTNDVTNWITNLTGFKTNYSYCKVSGCQVHQGFFNHYESIKAQVESSFLSLKAQYPNAKIYLTGHSLGAAAATLALPHLYSINGNKKLDVVYHFYSPRVGNQAYSSWLKSQNHFTVLYGRITHGQDPVVQNPSSWFPLFFYHTSQEIFYIDFSTPRKLCLNAEDTSCGAQSQYVALDINDHMNILGWDSTVFIPLCQV